MSERPDTCVQCVHYEAHSSQLGTSWRGLCKIAMPAWLTKFVLEQYISRIVRADDVCDLGEKK